MTGENGLRGENGGSIARQRSIAIETEQEEDGRWLAEVPGLPGVMAYGQTREEAIRRVESLALRVIADRLDHGESVAEVSEAFFVVA